jgi:hypothetical protein
MGAVLLAAAVFDSFDGPLDPLRWFVGIPGAPEKGWLAVPRDGWVVARGLPEERERIEVTFRHRGGALEFAFLDEREPLSSPLGTLLVPAAAGVRTLVVTASGAEVDGVAVDPPGWKGTFRLRAVRGDVEIDEVRVSPRVAEPPPPGTAVFAATTPLLYREGDGSYSRETLTLWDVDIAVLLARGPPAFSPLKAPPKGAPVLGALVTAGDAGRLMRAARSHPLARRDFGDETGNLSAGDLELYLKAEYALFALLMDLQRALNAAVPSRKGLDALVHLAVIRHSVNARAAVALAETEGARDALAALRKALGDEDPARASGDRLRAAAGEAARAILGDPPPEWPGFSFGAARRFEALERAKGVLR